MLSGPQYNFKKKCGTSICFPWPPLLYRGREGGREGVREGGREGGEEEGREEWNRWREREYM